MSSYESTIFVLQELAMMFHCPVLSLRSTLMPRTVCISFNATMESCTEISVGKSMALTFMWRTVFTSHQISTVRKDVWIMRQQPTHFQNMSVSIFFALWGLILKHNKVIFLWHSHVMWRKIPSWLNYHL